MQTGENQHALRRVLDMTRMISLALLLLHTYYYGYVAFAAWGLHSAWGDRVLSTIGLTGLFDHFNRAKWFSLLFLTLSLWGVQGRKDIQRSIKWSVGMLMVGTLLYFSSSRILSANMETSSKVCLYLGVTFTGYLLVLSGGTWLSRILKPRWENPDLFNRDNESFPQEERLLRTSVSINLRTTYLLDGHRRKGWINIVNPFRGLLIAGMPGSGKSYFVIRHVITQQIKKGFTLFIYDFKFDDLTKIAYNAWLKYPTAYQIAPRFFVINFEDLSRSHRCNPLDPALIHDVTDAAESARTILLGLNREWIRKQGDFFVESAINFLTALIWYLRRYRNGAFCTLPHVIELMQLDYDSLFTLLRTEPDIEVLVNPFVNAYLHRAMDQLEGQMAAAKVAMARLSSPSLYYVLSGNDFTLDLNNPASPKIICMGNHPGKVHIYGAVLSLYINRMVKLVNRKGQLPSSLIFDEFPTIYVNQMDQLMATARSNRVATCLGIQDFSQLRKDYGREQADVIFHMAGNVISGQVTGDTAQQLSQRVGKILQKRESHTVNSSEVSRTYSRQLDLAVPVSRIATLSSGEFVGMVADEPSCPIDLKTFHGKIIQDHRALQREEKHFQKFPAVRRVDRGEIRRNYLRIREDIQELVQGEMSRLLDDPRMGHLIVKKGS